MVRNYYRGRVWTLLLIPFMLALTPLFFVLDDLQRLLAPADVLFMARGMWHSFAWVAFMCTLALILFVLVASVFPSGWQDIFVAIRKWLYRYALAIVAILLLFLYVVTTSVTYVTPNAIIDCSAFRPGGTYCTYEDVTAISTGYDYYDRSTDFYYIISLKDGPDVNLVHPLIVDEEHYGEYEKHEEIAELDAVLMERDIPKDVYVGNFWSRKMDSRTRYHIQKVFNNT